MQNLDEQAIYIDTLSDPQFDTNNISMPLSENALDNMSQVSTNTSTITPHTTPLLRMDENQSSQVNLNNQAMNSLQPVQDHLAPDSSSLDYPQETVVTNEHSFFYAPHNDFQIYRITCEEIPLSFELVSQLINRTDKYSHSNNIYVFYHEQPETKRIYKITCEMISHTVIFQFLNKIIYGNIFTQYEHQQQEFSNSHQENLKFHLKKDLTNYLVPKQTHGQNYDSFSNIDVVNHPQKYNTNITSQQDSSHQFLTFQNRSDNYDD